MDSDKKLIQLSHHAGAKLLEGDVSDEKTDVVGFQT